MRNIFWLLLLFLPTVPACFFHDQCAHVHSLPYELVRDYLGLEEGVLWRYSFGPQGEEAMDTLLLAVVSVKERDGSTLFKIQEEWGPTLSQKPLQGYYWAYDEREETYYEVGRWNENEDFFYGEDGHLFILPRELSVGDAVFENYTLGDSFTVMGQEMVQVPAGSFQAWVLTAQWGDLEEGPWEKDRIYFAPHMGMVKRELVRGYSLEGQVKEEFPFLLELVDYSQDRSD